MILADDLGESTAFAGLRPDHLSVLERYAARRRIEVGSAVLRSGAPATEFFVVQSGLVAIEVQAADQGRVVIDTAGPRQLVGWSWLRPPYRWHFDAVASEPTEVIAVGAEPVRREMGEHHEFGYAVLDRFAQLAIDRLIATRLRLLDLYGTPSA